MILVLIIIAIVSIPLIFMKDSEFQGADDQAGDVIGELNPNYEPWVEAWWEPPSGEVESLLFSLQIGIGAATIGYIFGILKERRKLATDR